MSSPENLLKATLNRLAARLEQKLTDTVAGLSAIAQEAPERLKKEWRLFQEEIIAESERLEKEFHEQESEVTVEPNMPKSDKIQEKIDRLRTKVSELSQKIEGTH